ncbi:MAG: hypothetical protein Q9211_002449 [Gyalolechia sp. 1 TL-2023]
MNHSIDAYTTDINAMLHDVSNQMARAQLFRRLSAKSNHSSPGSMRGNTRVVKPHSSGGTPLSLQRRRTTAAHTTRSKPPVAPPFQQLPQAAKAIPPRPRRNGLPSATRPVTWHPGSYHFSDCSQPVPSDGGLAFYPTTTPQESYFTDYPIGAMQPSLGFIQPLEAHERDDVFSNDYTQQPMADYSHEFVNDNSFNQSSLCDPATQFSQHDTMLSSTYCQYPSSFQTKNPVQMPSDHVTYSTQHLPILSSSGYACDPPQYLQFPNPPQVTKQQSKELVGMGLYDGLTRKELSTPDTSMDRIKQLLAAPQGKGLKLEETWQPPPNEEVDEDEEADEGSSADEGEEDPPPAPAQAEMQPNFYPSYGDLSNQSFFFDNDDPYASCMSFNQEVQVCPPKAAEPSYQNFMWL